MVSAVGSSEEEGVSLVKPSYTRPKYATKAKRAAITTNIVTTFKLICIEEKKQRTYNLIEYIFFQDIVALINPIAFICFGSRKAKKGCEKHDQNDNKNCLPHVYVCLYYLLIYFLSIG
jgi:hypothetical protein